MKLAICHPNRRDISKGLCSACYTAARYKENPERARGHSAKYYKANTDKCNARSSAFKKNNPEKSKSHQLKKYNISFEQYKELLAQQDECCAICNRHQSEFSKDLCVDHDHVTGKVRGLLCFDCNTALGKFKDSKDLLEKAILYLNGDK